MFSDEYFICIGCKSPDTVLSKENRLFFLRCEKCGSGRSVATIKAGFVARVGWRNAGTRAPSYSVFGLSQIPPPLPPLARSQAPLYLVECILPPPHPSPIAQPPYSTRVGAVMMDFDAVGLVLWCYEGAGVVDSLGAGSMGYKEGRWRRFAIRGRWQRFAIKGRWLG
ncbi:hypothetical protein Pint_11809 [Pistacia integerrima]|uniref:Uncharacterized protein n=1 Tax=Pistacia integerrima TaxID=434235 RepID=A0ACC0XEL8_9ROSI|nr:hypothetical protein Pint_11809 [Pistacia integerrima]